MCKLTRYKTVMTASAMLFLFGCSASPENNCNSSYIEGSAQNCVSYDAAYATISTLITAQANAEKSQHCEQMQGQQRDECISQQDAIIDSVAKYKK